MILRAATVKYLNALPFLHALKKLEQDQLIELVEAIPSACSDQLQKDQVDIALIPVGAISDFSKLFLLSDYCISCDGAVRTVKLFSEFPIDKLQQIVLDSSSRSSNKLVQLLCKHHWNKQEILFTDSNHRDVGMRSGFVKIGDDVFDLENKFAFEYDLGQEWKAMTGLPFVFAIWVSKKQIDPLQINMLNAAFKESLAHMDEIISANPSLDRINLNGYFEKNIYYNFDESKQVALHKFLELAGIKNPLV